MGADRPITQQEALMEENIDPKESQEQHNKIQEDRKRERWGEMTKHGLIVGRGDTKRIIPPEEVEKLASYHCTNTEIAEFFDIPIKTLEYNFAKRIQKAKMTTKQRLRRAQLEVALKGNVPMLIWLGKNMLGQSDQPIDSGDLQPLPWNDGEIDNKDDK